MTDKPKTTRRPRAKAPPATDKPTPGPVGRTAAEMAATPTVGRIVHMYDHGLPEGGHGGKEHGPYAAIVTGVRPAGKAQRVDTADHSVTEVDTPETVDLWVMPPASTAYERGGVPYQEAPHPHNPGAAPEFHRYWTWPPRA